LTTFIIKPWELLPKSELMEILPRSLAALAFASLLTHLGRQRSVALFMNGGVLLFFAFMGWIFLSTLTAYNSAEAMENYSIGLFPVIATFLLIVNSSAERLDLEVIRGGLIVAVMALSSIAYVHTLWGWGFNFNTPIPRLEGRGQWANANDLAALMVLALPMVTFPLIVRSRSILNRLFGLVLIVFLLFGIWLSQSRGALLAIMLGIMAYILTSFKLRLRLLVPASFVLLVPVILFSTIHRESSDISGSNSMRLEYLLTGLRMLKTNPITGIGFENYDDLYERYTTRFEEYGKRTAHSSWVLALAETGIPGLLLFVWLFLYVLRRSFQLRHAHPEMLVAMVSYGTCMTLLSHTYQLAPYVLFAWILSARRWIAPFSSQPEKVAATSAIA